VGSSSYPSQPVREDFKTFYDNRYSEGYMADWDSKKKLLVFEIISALNLDKTGQAIDFGCGNGVFSDVIKIALPAWKVFGTDISLKAICNAKQRFSKLSFFELSESQKFPGKFDFLFTHHVLEHVFDLDETWSEMDKLLKKSACMLHILPCGNKGSFEQKISLLVKNGINPINGRFFFEEPGHLRRLRTEQMNLFAAKFGFHLYKAYYRNHYWTSIQEITISPKFVLEVANPNIAKNKESAIELEKLRCKLLLISALRLPLDLILSRKKNEGFVTTLFSVLLKIFLLPIGSLSLSINFLIGIKAKQEWSCFKNREEGGEMYLFYKRTSDETALLATKQGTYHNNEM
jgi:ubiquinone/menaquinone biosynthesis C-methylase UbiE